MQHDFDAIIDRRGGDSEKWNRYGEDVLPLWVADSDFTAPQPVVDALARRVSHGVFGYPDHMDHAVERAAAHWMQRRFGWQVDPAWVCGSPGVSAALSLAINAFSGPGEGVLMFTPTYPPFIALTKANGREALSLSLVFENGNFCIDWADVERKARKAKLFLLCNPQNPTGRVFSRDELLKLGEICLEHGVTVFSDEVHCDFIAPGKRHIPFASLSGDLANISLTAINPSKTFSIAGLQTAAVIASNPALLELFRRQSAKSSLWANTFGVIAFHTSYMQCAYYADQAAAYIRQNLALAVEHINASCPGLKAYMPESTYLLWLHCEGLGLDPQGLEDFFLNEAKVALNSGLTFGPEGRAFMRMNTACPRSFLKQALERISQACARRS